jgi:aryl-alcohol dehydrogenase-like predicted oxidoreductase
MTKVTLMPDEVDDVTAAVRRTFAGSLERLRTDRVDLLIVHNLLGSARGRPYSRTITIDDARRMLDAMSDLVAEERVGHLGFSAWRSTRAAQEALFTDERVEVIQTEVNLLNPSSLGPVPASAGIGVMEELERDHDDASMEPYGYRGTDQHEGTVRAAALGLGVVGIRPLLAGVLADEIDRPVEPGSELARMRAKADRLRVLLDARRPRLSGLAMRYALSQPGVSTVVPGIKNVEEIEDAVAALDLPELSAEELARVAAIVAGEDDA